MEGDNDGIIPFKVFGCMCFVKDNRSSVEKLDPRVIKYVYGIFGYS
jgi:hypothetical protein